jgi:hypothetical protein
MIRPSHRPTWGAALLLCWLAASPAGAELDLYAAEVPVASAAADERTRAFGEALAAVLVKLTGSRAVVDRPGVETVLAQAPGMVQQYRYRTDPAAPEGGARLLWVRFDGNAVQRSVSEQGWQVWREPRPRLLVWLGAERSGRRTLLNPEASPDLARALREQGERRGISVQWPLLDLEDQSRLAPADLWSGFEEAIREASQRYGQGPVLVGRLTAMSGGGWRPEWLLYDRGGVERFAAGRAALPEVLRGGVDRAADLLVARLAPAVPVGGGAQASVSVRLRGIATLSDYAAALQVLAGAPGVSRLSLRNATAGAMDFDVWLAGDARVLTEALSADPRLQREPMPTGPSEADRISFYWLE